MVRSERRGNLYYFLIVKDGWGLESCGPELTFGPDITRNFNRENNLKMIVRGH
jgi:hypothetical protein